MHVWQLRSTPFRDQGTLLLLQLPYSLSSCAIVIQSLRHSVPVPLTRPLLLTFLFCHALNRLVCDVQSLLQLVGIVRFMKVVFPGHHAYLTTVL